MTYVGCDLCCPLPGKQQHRRPGMYCPTAVDHAYDDFDYSIVVHSFQILEPVARPQALDYI